MMTILSPFNIYNLFIYILSMYMILLPLAALLAFAGESIFFHVPKIPFIAFFLLSIVHLLTRQKLKIHLISLLFLVYLPLALVIGYIEHGFNMVTISHIYTTVMPILAISFGAHFFKQYEKSKHISSGFDNLMNASLVVYCILFPLYMFLHYIGLIKYWGLGTSGLTMVALFMLSQKEYSKYIISIILVLLSGKRSILVVTLLSSIVVLKPNFISKISFKNVIIALLLIVTLFGIFSVASEFDLLRRFELTKQFDLSDDVSMYNATGGRYQEVKSVVDYLSDNGYWIFGGGFGVKYSTYDLNSNEIVRHYSHFTPLAYVLVYGVIFTLLFYIVIIVELIRTLRCYELRSSFFGLMFIALFINSFFGASLFTDPLFWVFFGSVRLRNQK